MNGNTQFSVSLEKQSVEYLKRKKFKKLWQQQNQKRKRQQKWIAITKVEHEQTDANKNSFKSWKQRGKEVIDYKEVRKWLQLKPRTMQCNAMQTKPYEETGRKRMLLLCMMLFDWKLPINGMIFAVLGHTKMGAHAFANYSWHCVVASFQPNCNRKHCKSLELATSNRTGRT